MDAAMWQIISIAGYSLAGLAFISAIIMFFKMNIPAIIGDLTGRTAAKQIAEIREQNSKSGQKRFQPDAFNLERGQLTENVEAVSRKLGWTIGRKTSSKRLDAKGQTVESSHPSVAAGMTSEAWDSHEEPVYGSEGTAVLFSGDGFLQEAESKEAKFPPEFNGSGTWVLSEGAFAENLVASSSEPAGFSAETEVLVLDNEILTHQTQYFHRDSEETLEVDEDPPMGAEVLFEISEVLSVGTEFLFQETEIPSEGTQVLSGGTKVLSPGTEILSSGEEALLPERQYGSYETEVLSGEPYLEESTETWRFSAETEMLDGGTELLSPEGTTVLAATSALENVEAVGRQALSFKLVKDMVIIHTDETI